MIKYQWKAEEGRGRQGRQDAVYESNKTARRLKEPLKTKSTEVPLGEEVMRRLLIHAEMVVAQSSRNGSIRTVLLHTINHCTALHCTNREPLQCQSQP